MKCAHPSGCSASATSMCKVVGESTGYVGQRARVEVITGIVTCDQHFPGVVEIGPKIKGALSDQLKHQGKRPPFRYSVEKLPLDSDQVRLYLDGGGTPH